MIRKDKKRCGNCTHNLTRSYERGIERDLMSVISLVKKLSTGEADSPMCSYAFEICNQISSVFAKPSGSKPPALDVMVKEITEAAGRRGKIFVFGVGREGLMMKGLCMRLAHLGLSAHCVFDMTAPPISSSDLLIVSAGPGGFPTVNAVCGIARSNKARIVFVTAQPESVSAQEYASVVAYIPAQTMADGGKLSSRELLPMGSVFEGAMFVLFEMVVYRLGESLGQTPEAIRSRHTNLE